MDFNDVMVYQGMNIFIMSVGISFFPHPCPLASSGCSATLDDLLKLDGAQKISVPHSGSVFIGQTAKHMEITVGTKNSVFISHY